LETLWIEIVTKITAF